MEATTVETRQEHSGRMTSAMRAIAPRVGPKVLRVALIRGGAIVDERLAEGPVTIGPGPGATLLVPLRADHTLFEGRPGRRFLVLAPGMRARLADARGIVELG